MMAMKGGASFALVANDCLQGLKIAIEYATPQSTKDKKAKTKQFNHSKDNAISALGKIIKYQYTAVDAQSLIPNWLSMLPIKHDIEESKIQNDILA